MSQATVSVVIPAWNSEVTVAGAIRSALAQDYPIAEVIVADDGSTDRTAAIAGEFGGPVRMLRLPHRGQAAATNAGLDAARGDYVAILHDDDEWLPEKTRRQVEALERSERAGIAYCDLFLVHPDGSGSGTFLEDKAFAASGRIFEALVEQCFVLPSAAMFRRTELHDGELRFPEDLTVAVDYEIWLRAARRFEFVRNPEPLVRRLLRPGAVGTDLRRLREDHVTLFRRLREQVLEEEGSDAPALPRIEDRLAGFEAGLGYDRYRAGDVAGARQLLRSSLRRSPSGRTLALWITSLGGRPGRALVAALRGWQD